MQQLKITERKLLSEKVLDALKNIGKKPKLVEERVTSLWGNDEVNEIAPDVIKQSEFTGAFYFDAVAFESLSRILEHQEIKDNYYKFKKVIQALNEARPKKKENK